MLRHGIAAPQRKSVASSTLRDAIVEAPSRPRPLKIVITFLSQCRSLFRRSPAGYATSFFGSGSSLYRPIGVGISRSESQEAFLGSGFVLRAPDEVVEGETRPRQRFFLEQFRLRPRSG
jgi:hypothetical protein